MQEGGGALSGIKSVRIGNGFIYPRNCHVSAEPYCSLKPEEIPPPDCEYPAIYFTAAC